MRVTYAVSVTIILLAMVVAYRYLPARAQPVGGVEPGDVRALSGVDDGLERSAVVITGRAD
jgi:hypothetical protein